MPSSLAAVQAHIDLARLRGERIELPIVNRQQPSAVDPGASPLPAGEGLGVRSAQGQKSSSFDDLIRAAAAREGLDPALVKAVATAESGMNASAVSSAGAKGLMQLMDGTARELGVRDSFDPAQNVAGGAKYLKKMLDRYDGDVKRALAAYNAGPGNVDAYGGVPPFTETRAYVERVLNIREASR